METRSRTRQSLGLPPLKRRSQAEDVRPPARPRKKPRPAPKKKFPLMKLPTEVRLKILEELLVCNAPLRISNWVDKREDDHLYIPPYSTLEMWKNFKLYPEILRSCKQLSSEGTPLLYDKNSIDVQFHHRYQGDYSSAFLRPGWTFGVSFMEGLVPSTYLQHRVRKLHVTFQSYTSYDARDAREMVRTFVLRLNQLPNIKSLTIHFEQSLDVIDYSDDEESEPDWSADEVLRCLNLARGLEHVSFTGMTPKKAEELITLMTGHTPIVNLPMMAVSLRTYCENVVVDLEDQDDIWDALDHADMMMDMDSVEGFLAARKSVMDCVGDLLKEYHAAVFADDPASLREK